MIRILLIEDDKHIAGELQYLLRSEGYEADAVYTAEEGEKSIEKGDYHLIL